MKFGESIRPTLEKARTHPVAQISCDKRMDKIKHNNKIAFNKTWSCVVKSDNKYHNILNAHHNLLEFAIINWFVM